MIMNALARLGFDTEGSNVDVALRSYILTTASETKLTNPDEVQEATTGLKVRFIQAQTVYRKGP
jgi:hypothetical protein